MKTAVFTIASKNYFAYVRTIMQSLEQSNPHMERYVVVVDELDDEFLALPRNFNLLELNKLDLPHPNQMKFRYDVMELNTAVKPFAILKLFEQFDRVIYLDPDIFVYKKLQPIEDALDNGANFVLTPHFNGLFEDDGYHPDEPDIMRCGIYNLGFIALNKCNDTLEMVSWWADKLEKTCINEQEKGIFVDQKWIDLVPGFYENVAVLHHSGLNVAYWNLSHRKIKKVGNDFQVNGEPLIFFHFSGLNPNNIDAISKYQNRYSLADLGDGADLFVDYAKIVLSNEFDMWKKFKYSYDNYTDGRSVLNEHRMKYRNDPELQGVCGENPFEFAEIFYEEKKIQPISGGVNLVGYLCSEHGLGEAARLTANCLDAANIQWSGYDFAVGNSSRKNDKTYENKIEQYVKYDTSIININADQFEVLYSNTPKKLWDTYKIGIWYWELPEFPEQWMKAFMHVDEIWAPTKFIAECLRKCAPCPVYHMPPGISRKEVNTEIYNREYFGLPKDAFLFLNMFDVYSFAGRKNPEAAVKAFKKAFSPDDMSVGLVLKLNNSGYTDEVRKNLDKLIENYKNIYIIAKTFPRDAVNGLLNICDVAVSLHRSEGLGLLCEEAMYYGKPVIATGWSGNMDFMTAKAACLVDYEMCKVGKNIGPYEAWQEWADPNVEQATAYMKRLASDKEYYEAISKEAKIYVRENFSPEVCGNRMKERLEQIRQTLNNGYTPDRQKTLTAMAGVCLAYYQKASEVRLDAEQKKQLVESWSNGWVIDFDKVAEDLNDSKLVLFETDESFVQKIYEIFLNRIPSVNEVNSWVDNLQNISRTQVISLILKSEEFLGSYYQIYQDMISQQPQECPVLELNPAETNSFDVTCADELRLTNEKYEISYYNDLGSKGVVAFAKRVVRKINKFLLMPIIEQQQEFNAHVARYLNAMQQKQNILEQNHNNVQQSLVEAHNKMVETQNKLVKEQNKLKNESQNELEKTNQSISTLQTKISSNNEKLQNGLSELKEQLTNSVMEIDTHANEYKNTMIEVEGSRHNQVIHYLMEVIDANKAKNENATKDVELIKEAIKEKWNLVDSYEESHYKNHEISCPICGNVEETEKLEHLDSECIFNGGKLHRYKCAKCGVIFGPEKMLNLTDKQFSDDYEMHYSVYNEGDSTESEIEVFKKLNPNKEGIYLDWGVGAWSKVISTLRNEGYQVYGYDPYAPTDSEYVIKDEAKLKEMKFDGIFSHDLLEHLKDPVSTFELFASVLKPNGKMAHSTACYDYVYEYTRFHLYFYTGHSVEELCDKTGFRVSNIEKDPVNLIITYTYEFSEKDS